MGPRLQKSTLCFNYR